MSKMFLQTVIDPTLLRLVPHGIPVTDSARAMLYAIGLQESAFEYPFQVIDRNDLTRKGPARGYWQFELGGGVRGVLSHKASSAIARIFTAAIVGSNSTNEGAVWATLEFRDELACILARLLLWTDPKPLPDPILASMDTAWDYYIRNWRPGKEKPKTWPGYWQAAVSMIREPVIAK